VPEERRSLMAPSLSLSTQQSHVAAGGKVWDTVKPLAIHFGGPESLGRVVLVDNDAHKALPDEAGNMLLVPTWDGPPGMMSAGAAGPHPPPPDPDRVLLHLADTLLDPVAGLAGEAVGDVRDRTAGVAARVAAASAADEAAAAATSAALPVPPQTRVRTQAVPAPAGPARALPDPSNGLSGGAAAAVTPGVATPGTPGGLPDERAAWATAVAAAVAELGATSSAPLASIIAYARFRAPGAAVQAFLTKRAVKEAVAALARGGRLVAAALPADAKVVAGKHLKACYGLAPGTALPEGGVTAAVDALRSLVAGVKPPASASLPRKKNKGGKAGSCGGGTGSVESVRAQHGEVRATIDTVVLASVADLTAVRFFGFRQRASHASPLPHPCAVSAHQSRPGARVVPPNTPPHTTHPSLSLLFLPPERARAQHGDHPQAHAGRLRPTDLRQRGGSAFPAAEPAGRGENSGMRGSGCLRYYTPPAPTTHACLLRTPGPRCAHVLSISARPLIPNHILVRTPPPRTCASRSSPLGLAPRPRWLACGAWPRRRARRWIRP